jgi:hypothetical protein
MKESWCACVRGRWQRNLVCTQQHRTTVWGWKITDVSLNSADCFHAAIVNSNSCLRSSPSPLLVSHRSQQHPAHPPLPPHIAKDKKKARMWNILMKRSGRAGLRGSPRGEQAGSCPVCAMRCGGCWWWCCCYQLRQVPTAGEDESGPQQPRPRVKARGRMPIPVSTHTDSQSTHPLQHQAQGMRTCARRTLKELAVMGSWPLAPPPTHTHQQEGSHQKRVLRTLMIKKSYEAPGAK